MKLSASVLALVAAAGCESTYYAVPTTPQPIYGEPPVEIAPVDPTPETTEPVEFAKPPPEIAPIQRPVRRTPPPPPLHVDDCPACGMG